MNEIETLDSASSEKCSTSFFSFPKSFRLLRQKHFKEVMRRGRVMDGKFLMIHLLPTQQQPVSKLGLTVSRKFGKAHFRNRFKRLVREAFRLSHTQLKVACFLNIRPKPEAKEASFSQILEEFNGFIEKINAEKAKIGIT